MFRYFGLVWDPGRRDLDAVIARLTCAICSLSDDWRCVYGCAGLRVFCAGIQARANRVHALGNEAGVVLGTLCGTDARELGESESAAIVNSAGRHLINAYWGSYVALLCHPRTQRKNIIKDPTGNLPCFLTVQHGVHVFFSSLTECIRIGQLRFTVNDEWVRARIAAGFLGADGNPLCEVSEVVRGECVEIDGDRSRRTFYWHPTTVAETGIIEDPTRAAEELRATTTRSCHAWVAAHPGTIHRLSGGFDSSLVLVCMSDAPNNPDITCLTYFARDALSDERPWARLVAKTAGCRHIEWERNPHTDLRKILDAAPAVSPEILSTYLEGGAIERSLAAEHGATMITNGEGGDALLGRHARRQAAIEYIRRHGFRRELLRIVENVALQTDRSVWAVWREIIQERMFHDSTIESRATVLEGRRLVSSAIVVRLAELHVHPHPWFRSLDSIPWGLVQKLGTLLYPPAFYDPFSRPESADPEPVAPLCSQPLVELCLRIPTYVHLHDGRDRGLARTAFADRLPTEITRRQWKDRAPRYFEEMVYWNRSFLREILLGGKLAAAGLLDRQRVAEALSDRPTTSMSHVSEILDHACLEAWLQVWAAVNAGKYPAWRSDSGRVPMEKC